MALTFADIIGQGGVSPRGAEARDPSFVGEGGNTPVRPIPGMGALPRLQAPTFGERVGEAVIKTTRARFEQLWAYNMEEIALTYKTDQARLDAIDAERERLQKYLQDLDQETHQLAVAKAQAGGKSEYERSQEASLGMFRAQIEQEKNIAEFAFKNRELKARTLESIESDFSIPSVAMGAMAEIRSRMERAVQDNPGSHPNLVVKRLLDTDTEFRKNFGILMDASRNNNQRVQVTNELANMMTDERIGADPFGDPALRNALEKTTNAALLTGNEIQTLKEMELNRRVGSPTGTRRVEPGAELPGTGKGRGTGVEGGTGAPSAAEQAEAVNSWARSIEGQMAMKALEDGVLSEAEAEEIAKVSYLEGDDTRIRSPQEIIAKVGEVSALAFEPMVGPLVSTTVRRALDPRRVETLAALRALGEERTQVKEGMVTPTQRNIMAATQEERLAERQARQAQREAKKAAPSKKSATAQAALLQTEQMNQTLFGGQATPAQLRFAQAMHRATSTKAPMEAISPNINKMWDAYQKGGLRDHEEVLDLAIEITRGKDGSVDDKAVDEVLTSYLRRVMEEKAKRGPQEIDLSQQNIEL